MLLNGLLILHSYIKVSTLVHVVISTCSYLLFYITVISLCLSIHPIQHISVKLSDYILLKIRYDPQKKQRGNEVKAPFIMSLNSFYAFKTSVIGNLRKRNKRRLRSSCSVCSKCY